MFLIAPAARALARWNGAERQDRREQNSQYLTQLFPREAGHDEYDDHDATIENGFRDLHRQVDTQDFVFP